MRRATKVVIVSGGVTAGSAIAPAFVPDAIPWIVMAVVFVMFMRALMREEALSLELAPVSRQSRLPRDE